MIQTVTAPNLQITFTFIYKYIKKYIEKVLYLLWRRLIALLFQALNNCSGKLKNLGTNSKRLTENKKQLFRQQQMEKNEKTTRTKG